MFMRAIRPSIFVLLVLFLFQPSALLFSDHAHQLSLTLAQDTALQDIELDIVALVVTSPIEKVALGNEEYETNIEIEDVLRGGEKAGTVHHLMFKPLHVPPEIPAMASGHVSSIVKPADLKPGDRIIACVKPGPPMIANGSAIYMHNSVSRYQIKQQMAKQSFFKKYLIFIVLGLALLLVLINRKTKAGGH